MTLPHHRSVRTDPQRRPFRSAADRALGRWLVLDHGALPALADYASTTLLRSPMGRAIELHVFPGQTSRPAIVIGGVHGTEFVGVEVTRRLIGNLRSERCRNQLPYFTTIVVPALFPDNLPASHGGAGRGRRATRNRADPNRQFPTIDANADIPNVEAGCAVPTDACGRPIEPANIALLKLIQRCRPRRIASVHAIQKPGLVGIYSDPHPGAGTDLSAEAASLAERVHDVTTQYGGYAPGYRSVGATYPHQDEVDTQGISLGAWASQAIPTGPNDHDAVPVITLELKRDWTSGQARRRSRNIQAFMLGIRRGFLER